MLKVEKRLLKQYSSLLVAPYISQPTRSTTMYTMDPFLRESMQAIQPTVAEVVADHERTQKLWMPTELIPEDHVFPELPPETSGMLVLNLITEDGLPNFTGLLVKHIGDVGPVWEWNKLWTAEEKRHGDVIELYLRGALTREQWIAIEHMQYEYMRNTAFWPDWHNDPYRLFAYVIIQELATQDSHAGIARMTTSVDPILTRLMGRIAGEERRHHEAYLRMFTALMEINPSHAVDSFCSIIRNFYMPGKGMPHFEDLAVLQQRLGAFGPIQFYTIVEKLWHTLNIESLENLNDIGEKARDTINRTLKTLLRVAERAGDEKKRRVHLPFLGEHVSVTV